MTDTTTTPARSTPALSELEAGIAALEMAHAGDARRVRAQHNEMLKAVAVTDTTATILFHACKGPGPNRGLRALRLERVVLRPDVLKWTITAESWTPMPEALEARRGHM